MERSPEALILFDGVCNFCSGAVNFIIARDPQAHFSFASLQSTYAHELLLSHGVTLQEPYDTFLLYVDGKLYEKSDAALMVARKLGGFWSFFALFRIIPRPIRDSIYTLIARNRYRFLGKKDSCMVPTPEIRERFLG